MKKVLLLSAFLLAIPLMLAAQYYTNQNKQWAFGIYVGMDFTSGSPSLFSTPMQAGEGSASVADAAGNILFYTNGSSVYNRTGLIMPAGLGIVPFPVYSTTQAVVIAPQPGSTTLYYVFSLEFTAGNIAAPPVGRLAYSIVDMSLNGGLGDVTTAGVPIIANLGEKMITVGGNGCNIWLLVHSRDSALFRAYEISSSGLNTTPVISNVGSLAGPSGYSAGTIKVSHDRTRLAAMCSRWQPGGQQGVELYDFNATTGTVSNCRVLTNSRSAYGAEFSPDNTRLYTTENNGAVTELCQYNISLPTTAAIVGSRYVISSFNINMPGYMGDMRLACDNKIYRISDFAPPAINRYIDVIGAPNNPGASCGFALHAINVVAPDWLSYGVPNLVWAVDYDSTFERHDTAGCFSASGIGTIASPHTGTGYLWQDGVTTATHSVTGPGTYRVAVLNGCDVIVDTIVVHNVSAPPPPVITGVDEYCYGEPFVPPTASGTNILWYPSSTSTTASATPPVINTSVPGVYTVYATQTIGCESVKAPFIITVHPRVEPSFTVLIDHGCLYDTVYFTNTSVNADTYTWNFGDGSPASTSATMVTHAYTAHGVYSVTLTGTSAAGCMGDTTIELDTRYPIHAGFMILPDTLCEGAFSTFIPNVPASALSSYLWRFGDGSTGATVFSPVHSYSLAGIYPVSFSITDTAGCRDSVTENVCVLGVRIKMPHDTTFCLTTPMLMENTVYIKPGFPIPDTVYSWSPATHLSDAGIQQPFFNGLGTLTYTFTATIMPYGCTATDTIRLSSVRGKPITRVPYDTTILLGHSVQLFAWNEVFYMWRPNDGSLNDPNINNPIATPTATTRYTVLGYDEDGCLDSAFVTIYVDSGMAECIPLAFTPNGDGLNDVFRPLCLRQQKIVQFNIYSRWGELVYEATTADVGWDGTYKGIPMELGVYFYMLEIARPDGRNIVYKGDVTLIR